MEGGGRRWRVVEGGQSTRRQVGEQVGKLESALAASHPPPVAVHEDFDLIHDPVALRLHGVGTIRCVR